MPLHTDIKKVLVIGSGPIVIGQAAEFDYAGAQACRVLKQAGLNVVLCNSNPATIMTDQAMADEIYLEPLTVDSLTRIIKKERPDSLLAGLGGQTGLTLAMQLDQAGVLREYNVRLLGTDAAAIARAEDRELFKQAMQEIGQPVVPSGIATSLEQALEIAAGIGYPLILRPAYTLGGAGGGAAYDEQELRQAIPIALAASPIGQVLVERAIFGWKEIEFETLRDAAGNAIVVCSMENLDPIGVHTGDSIVVAPCQTLSNKEYQLLRTASLDIISHLDIKGGCNCQLALDPNSFEYAVIEVNPRVSRSSALASKASGYPIAKISSKIALGYTLDEIKNDVTGQTCACFEPALDYVVVKVPRWPFDKLPDASRTLGTQMKATGEVMAIANNFPAALMKAVRGAELGQDDLNRAPNPADTATPEQRLQRIDDCRLFTVFAAIKAGISLEQINSITKIDLWFLHQLARLAQFEQELATRGLDADSYARGKHFGYSDAALLRLSQTTALPCPARHAVYKMVDTCAAEFAAATPYFYASDDDFCEARELLSQRRDKKPVIMVLGSGPIRIGQGIEFDYSSVHCVWTLRQLGYETVIVNNNPETVSTDYDTADRLYFEPLCSEDVLNIIRVEQPLGVVVAFGGQTAIKLAQFLDSQGVRILGTSAESIDMAENRERFDALLEQFHIKRPGGRGVRGLDEALQAACELGYPVLLRPSYVIGGQNMVIAHNDQEVRRYMGVILAGGIEQPVLVDQYLMGTELEVDVICDGREVLIPGVMQHIERSGVHSGDSIAVYPPFSINDRMLHTIIDYSQKLALSLHTAGLINIQYLIYQDELYVIEVNPRASRTVPYISKVSGVPMVDLATRVMLGQPLSELGYGSGLYKTPPYVAVKAPVFSFAKITDANAALSPEMKSTGEVLGLGKNLQEAMFKALVSAGYQLEGKQRGGVLISVNRRDQEEVVGLARKLDDMGYKLYATERTAFGISRLGADVEVVGKLGRDNRVFQLLEAGRIDYIILTGSTEPEYIRDFVRLNHRAIQLGIPCLTSLDTANALVDILASRYTQANTELIDICNLRQQRQSLSFCKLHTCGNDFIFVENFDGAITCPESLCLSLCERYTGVGADGLVLLETSEIAAAKMRLFNADGTESMAGSAVLGAAKYLHDRLGLAPQGLSVEMSGQVHPVQLFTINDEVCSVRALIGQPRLEPAGGPMAGHAAQLVDYPLYIGGRQHRVTCVRLGDLHCVSFCERVEQLNVAELGQLFERAPVFSERVNSEFVHVVNPRTIKLRVWERGSGETRSCGASACAAVTAAIANGLCAAGEDITVKMPGGDLTVNCGRDGVLLSGETRLVFSGNVQY